jgi:hypothetical protein
MPHDATPPIADQRDDFELELASVGRPLTVTGEGSYPSRVKNCNSGLLPESRPTLAT